MKLKRGNGLEDVLRRIQSSHVIALQVGKVTAFFLETAQPWDQRPTVCIKIFEHSIGGKEIDYSDRRVFLLDFEIFRNSFVPISKIDRVIDALHLKAKEFDINQRPTFDAEIKALENILRSPADVAERLNSPSADVLGSIGDFKPTMSDYTYFIWTRKPGYTFYTIARQLIQPIGFTEHDRDVLQRFSDVLSNHTRTIDKISDPVGFLLERAQRLPVYAFETGNLRAYFIDTLTFRHTLTEIVHRIIRFDVKESPSETRDPIVYLIDYQLLVDVRVPLNSMNALISGLDQLPSAIRGGVDFPRVPSLYKELTAIESLIKSPQRENITIPLVYPIKAYGEFRPKLGGYDILAWVRNNSSMST